MQPGSVCTIRMQIGQQAAPQVLPVYLATCCRDASPLTLIEVSGDERRFLNCIYFCNLRCFYNISHSGVLLCILNSILYIYIFERWFQVLKKSTMASTEMMVMLLATQHVKQIKQPSKVPSCRFSVKPHFLQALKGSCMIGQEESDI